MNHLFCKFNFSVAIQDRRLKLFDKDSSDHESIFSTAHLVRRSVYSALKDNMYTGNSLSSMLFMIKDDFLVKFLLRYYWFRRFKVYVA